MGEIRDVQPAMLIVGAFSRHPDAFPWFLERASARWPGPWRQSDAFPFTETDYYTLTMGAGLVKKFFACERLIDPGELVEIKRQTNCWEMEFAAATEHPEPRPLNLDPGYLTPAKLVLASTKDHAHRIYLDQGIYAEVTLRYKHGTWQPWSWTFPDYRRADYHVFFNSCRHFLLDRLKGRGAAPA